MDFRGQGWKLDWPVEWVEDIGGRRETSSAEGGTRLSLFVGVRGCLSCGFSGRFAYVAVFGRSLVVVGVPVNVPVRGLCLLN